MTRTVTASSRRARAQRRRVRSPTPAPAVTWPARIMIQGVSPEIEGGRWAIKRVAGERVVVEADVFVDGYEVLSCVLRYRNSEATGWQEVPMEPLVNDRWRGSFVVEAVGRYRYTLQAWVDRFASWRRDIAKKAEAGQDVSVDILMGAELIAQAARRASGAEARRLRLWANRLRQERDLRERISLALDEASASLMGRYPDRRDATTYENELEVVVDETRARCGAWYELFPRSCSSEPGRHGTFKDCEARLEYVAALGFDVLYLPPIHPIGTTHRKGKNNAVTAAPDDPGSPWAIGVKEGGYNAVHPQLGTLADFRRLVAKAKRYGIEVALDLAYQCSPDHPYVTQHPSWFRWRPDGTVQFAENPPKKYEDIFPLNFETADWNALWVELKSVVEFWMAQGVRIFRVDNPHTKPFAFWEWLIADIKRQDPGVIFLSEAFTRPKLMYRLAALGFTQSYTYFAWRNTKVELEEYFTELTQTGVREFFRPNLWPNTPDILTHALQAGGRPAFMSRFILAATLGASYGIYGPAFELCEQVAREPDSEEYLNSEKYEIKHWNLDRPDSLKDLIARVNWIRRENPALHGDWSLQFHPVDNHQLICYSKRTDDLSNVILVIVNLDPSHTHSGWVELPLASFGLAPSQSYQVHDLISDARYRWSGSRNYVELNPHVVPAHIFRMRREQDVDDKL